MKDYSEYNLVVNGYKFLKDIGMGSFAKVIKAVNLKNQQLVAIKLYSKEKLSDKNKKRLVDNEIYSLTQLPQNEFLIKIIDHFWEENYYYIVYEFCEGGNLDKLLKQQQLSENDIIRIFRNIVIGVSFLHQNQVIHRDLKPENLLLKNNKIKIADLGFSQRICNKQKIIEQYGTPVYMAPEVLKNLPYDFKADIWSLGCIFYEMLFKKLPYYENSVKNLLKSIQINSIYNHETYKVSKFSLKILKCCLEPDQYKRVDIFTLKNLLKQYKAEHKKSADDVAIEIESLSQCSLKQQLLNLIQFRFKNTQNYQVLNRIILYCLSLQQVNHYIKIYLYENQYKDLCIYKDRIFQIFLDEQKSFLQNSNEIKEQQLLFQNHYLLQKQVSIKNSKASKNFCQQQLLKYIKKNIQLFNRRVFAQLDIGR